MAVLVPQEQKSCQQLLLLGKKEGAVVVGTSSAKSGFSSSTPPAGPYNFSYLLLYIFAFSRLFAVILVCNVLKNFQQRVTQMCIFLEEGARARLTCCGNFFILIFFHFHLFFNWISNKRTKEKTPNQMFAGQCEIRKQFCCIKYMFLKDAEAPLQPFSKRQKGEHTTFWSLGCYSFVILFSSFLPFFWMNEKSFPVFDHSLTPTTLIFFWHSISWYLSPLFL